MTVKNTEEANLRPLSVLWNLLRLGLQNVQDYGNSIFVVFSDNTLICICSVRFNMTTLLLTSFSRFMILKEDCLWIHVWRITEKQSLDFNELDVWVNFF